MSARRRRHGKGLVIAFTLLAVVAVLAVVGGGLVLYGRSQLEAPSASHGAAVTVQVQPGETLEQLADDLQAHGLIKSSFWFGWFAKFKHLASHLQAGQFKLDDGMGASAIIERLEGAPDVNVSRITFTEGMTAQQMADRVGKSDLGISADQYMAEVRTGSFTEPFLASRPAGASLEGFLFPDTYEVPKGSSAHQLVQMQLDDFAHRTAALLGAPPPNGLSVYQVVTLASIVEREARFDDDRPKVASAIYNRLADGMPLQADATVQYGLGITDREPTADELHQDTPYNTYLHAGLTPGPIANPGIASLQAAVHPASTKFLFWVADGCGHNHYAVTAQEHDRQVSQFLDSPCPSPSA